MIEKAKWKSLELCLHTKIVNQKQDHISGRIEEISATNKVLKDTVVVIPTLSLLKSPICPKTDGPWRVNDNGLSKP